MPYYINELTQQVVSTSMESSPVHILYATKEEPEAVLMSPGYLANLLVQAQKPDSTLKLSRNQMFRVAEYLELLTHIHNELDGTVWDAESCSNIADYFCARGLPVKDSADEPPELEV